LPEGILGKLDLNTFVVENTRLIDEKLVETESDLLVRTSLGGAPALIYILIEHKSYADRWAVFQLLKYMMRLWDKERVKSAAGKNLPIIVPVLLYHGTRKWRLPIDFPSYFAMQDELKAYVPAFRPILIDLQGMEDQDLPGSAMIQAVLKTLKYSRRNLRMYLEEILRGVSTVPMDERHRAFTTALLRYIVIGGSDVDEQDVDRAVRSLGMREVTEEYMTVAEQLIERGKREGILEGKREGILEGKKGSLLHQLSQKFGTVSEADEQRIMSTKSSDKLDQALGMILKSDSIEEILKPLR
jgi:predicted transposase/invertase (TIGR01784 family)